MDRKLWALLVLATLGLSTAALALAPLALDESYAWVEHTTSESAAQGVDGAWVGRAGFVLFGLGVLALAGVASPWWRQPGTGLLGAFAVFMIAVAAFSIRSWRPGASFDPTEDLLHSVAATAMGFAFAFGVTAVAMRRRLRGEAWRVLDVIAVAASVVLPTAMGIWGGIDGALQRAMFAIAYAWFGREAVAVMRRGAGRGFVSGD